MYVLSSPLKKMEDNWSVLNCVPYPHKMYKSYFLVTMTLLENNLCRCNQVTKSSYRIRVRPTSNDQCTFQRGRFTQTQWKTVIQCQRQRLDFHCTSHVISRNPRNCQKLAKKIPFLAFRRSSVLQCISVGLPSLRNSESINVC